MTSSAPAPPGYQPLDHERLPALLADLGAVRTLLGGQPEQWHVREVGDGNLNLVFLVDGPDGSVCVKQALPYVRAAGASWPMTLERALFETSYYAAVAPYVGARIPKVYHYDDRLYCIVMERLSPHIILRQGLMAGRRYAHAARDIGDYIARACFFTSDLAWPFERKMQGISLFAANQALVRITVDLVFCDPYRASPRNRHTSPQLDELVQDLRRDGPLKTAAARFLHKFLNEPQALIHGDLHSGSVMVTPEDTRVIDPEFAFYGPMGFDLGAFFGNLLLSWYAQPGHAAGNDDRIVYRRWILGQVGEFWDAFRSRFVALWDESTAGDVLAPGMYRDTAEQASFAAERRAYLDALFADMLGFGACKMIRRIVGFAHVLDFESIGDPALRSRCETGALAMARTLLTHPEQFPTMDDVIAAVPRLAVA